MKISKLIALILFAFVFSNNLYSQENKKELVQFSGIVVTADSVKPVSFTNIIVKGTSRGTITDYYGFFSFVACKGDEVIFSSIGYKKVIFKIPDTLNQNRYSLIQVMRTDTIMLAETVIYPWPTIEQFKQAFVKLNIPDDDLERAKKNLARAEMKDRMKNMPMDGSMNYKNYINKQVYNYSYMGMQKPNLTSMMNNPLLNPLAWAEFIKAWKRGDFKKDD